MFLHDDRSYVDERRHRSATLWIPLVDTGPAEGNGHLQVVPGSQRLATAMAGSNTPELFRPYERVLRSALVDVAVPAGHGLVYDTRVLHASPPNAGHEPREAIALAVAPRGADVIHVVADAPRHRRIHRVDDQFFVAHSPQEVERRMPERYAVVEEYEDDVRLLPPEAVAEVTGVPAPTPDPVVPPDLVALAEGRAPDPLPDRAVRVGTLVPAPTARPFVAGPDVPADGAWGPEVPARLVGLLDDEWTVGEPRVAFGGGAVALRLAPGERAGLRGPARDLAAVDGPVLGAGVVGPGRASSLVAGEAVVPSGDGPLIVWNHGPGDLVAVVVDPVGHADAVRTRPEVEAAVRW
jgi:hypothetical protein